MSIVQSAAANATPTHIWDSDSSADHGIRELGGACALLALMLQNQCATQSGAKADVEIGFKKMEELKQQLADAIQHAREAAEHSGFLGFLGKIFGSDIAKIAGAVAAVAATIASAGAATPLLLIAAAAALQVAAKAGAELGLDPKLCMALSIAAVAVGFASGAGAGQAASSLANGARCVEVGAKVTEGGAVITGGVLQYASDRYHADNLNYQADAAGYQASQTVTELDIDDALALLERALRAEQRETSTVSEMIQNDSESDTALCNRI